MKIYSSGNSVRIGNLGFSKGFQFIDSGVSDKILISSNTVSYRIVVNWQDITDEADNSFNSVNEVMEYLASVLNTTATPQNLQYISSLSDLPSPVSGVITLPNDNKYYFFNTLVDLEGNTLRFGANAFEGSSQEIGGVTNGNVEILETCTIRSFRFDDCSITMNNALGAYDWTHCNFYNCDITIEDVDNIVWETIGFIENTSVTITGTANSIIISPNCIFRSATNTNHTYLKFENTSTITRRIRIQDTPIQTTHSSQKGIEVISGASIPTEGFIMRRVTFSGSGAFLTGINGNDSQSRANFEGCSGGNIINTQPNAYLTMKDNATATPVSLATPTKILGTTTGQSVSQLFDLSVSNRAKYTGKIPRIFELKAILSLSSGNNNQIGTYWSFYDSSLNTTTLLENFEPYTTTNGAGRAENVATQEILTLEENDYIELWIENDSSTTSITVSDLSIIITQA